MNKVMLTVFVLAGVLCVTDAACSASGTLTCTNTFTSAVTAAGLTKDKLCKAISAYTSCVIAAGCDASQIKTAVQTAEQRYGFTCGSSMAKVSIAAMLLALVASYLWK